MFLTGKSLIIGFVLSLFLTTKSWQCTMNVPPTFICLVAEFRDVYKRQLYDRSLLNCLFHAVNSVISRMFFKLNKSKNFTPGFIMDLHTFGRDLKWNPHIPVSYTHLSLLFISFRKSDLIFLHSLEKHLTCS